MPTKIDIKELDQKKIDALSKQLYDDLNIKTRSATVINEDLNSITTLHNQQFENLYNDFSKFETN